MAADGSKRGNKMRSIAQRIGLLALMVMAAGCAGRNAAPVLASRADDVDRTCHELLREESLNQQRMTKLVREDEHIRYANAEVLTDAMFIPVAAPLSTPYVMIFFPWAVGQIDLQDAPQIELTAFQARNENLIKLASGKGC